MQMCQMFLPRVRHWACGSDSKSHQRHAEPGTQVRKVLVLGWEDVVVLDPCCLDREHQILLPKIPRV